jgi:hypothetical protein
MDHHEAHVGAGRSVSDLAGQTVPGVGRVEQGTAQFDQQFAGLHDANF